MEPLPREQGKTKNVLRTFPLKPRPESGLDCLISVPHSLDSGMVLESFTVDSCRFPGRILLNRDITTGGAVAEVAGNYFTEMFSGSEEDSYLRPIDFCITQF